MKVGSFLSRPSDQNQPISSILQIFEDEIETHVEGCMRPASSVTGLKLAQSARAGCNVCAGWSKAIELAKSDSKCSTVSLCTDRKYEGEFYTTGRPEDDGSQSSQVFYDIFTDSMNPAHIGNFTRRAFPSGYTGSEVALNFVRAQLANCNENHSLCHANELPPLPTRVVDFSNEDVVRLKDTRGQHGRYAALSHCWGNDTTFTTILTNYESHLVSLPLDRMPKTFTDAIDFCRKLGLSYIWIDSLCIIQDSRDDWLNESQQMKDIYQNAYITLAATASSGSNGGCYKEQRHQHTHIAQIEGFLSERIFLRRRWRHVNQTINGQADHTEPIPPLLRRGWVFQERLLSRRLVHFTDNEVMWECREMENCECLNGLLKDENPLDLWGHPESISTGFKRTFARIKSSSPPYTRATMWLALVERYSALSLSSDSDKLPALAGIARSMSGGEFGHYLAGLWGGHLGKGLCWMARQPPSRRLSNSNPSWSWTSIGGAVYYNPAWDCYRDTFLPLLSTSCYPAGPDIYGGVYHGWIKLEVELIEAALIPVSSLSASLQQQNARRRFLPFAICMEGAVRLCLWDDDSCLEWLNANPTDPLAVAPKSAIYCFDPTVKGTRTCLVLRCENWGDKVFRRIGVVGRKAERLTHLDWTLLTNHTQLDVDRISEGPKTTKCIITII